MDRVPFVSFVFFFFFFFFATVVAVECRSSGPPPDRDGRWFNAGSTVTKLYVDNLIVTSVVPSSCVAVAPTLPPCRGVRFLNIDQIFPSATRQDPSITETAAPLSLDPGYDARRRRPDRERPPKRRPSLGSRPDPSVEPTTGVVPEMSSHETPGLPERAPSGPDQGDDAGVWPGGYFDFIRGATVTKTATRLLTQTVLDPARTVTFSIKVCRPTRLPFDLPLCRSVDARPDVPDGTETDVDLRPAALQRPDDPVEQTASATMSDEQDRIGETVEGRSEAL